MKRTHAIHSAVLLAVLVAGCGGGDRGPTAAEVATWTVPQADLSRMEPQVAAILDDAREKLSMDRSSPEMWGNLGSLYDAHSLFDAAEECYRRAQELAPGDFRWNYLLAIAHDINGGNLDEVVPLFEAAAAIDPGYVPIYVRLGDAQARHGSNDEARVSLERAAELAPDVAVVHRLLGQVTMTLGDLEAAETHLRRAIELEPRDLAAHTALAQLYMRKGETERAEEAAARSEGLERVNVLDDSVYGQWVFDRSMSSSRAMDRAKIRMRDADYAAAARDLEVVLASGRGSADTHAMLGTAYAALGRTDEAIRQFEQAIRRNPDHPAREQLDALQADGR